MMRINHTCGHYQQNIIYIYQYLL